jgi:thiol-disulfide isomerase/thioredoxin
VGGVASLVLLAACSRRADKSEELRPGEIVKLDEADFQHLREQHRGRVLLVNFWATWCDPCREEFPALVRLDRAYRTQGLSIAAISMDEPESVVAVREFLKSQGAQFGSYLHNFHDFTVVVNSINPRWGGGIPATFLYDRHGRPVQSWEGATSFEEFDRSVRPLLP